MVYALAERQAVVTVQLKSGATARDAARASGLQQQFADIDLDRCPLGVFAKQVAADYPLANGDRVEIYRPLLADPKEVRRQLALIGKTIGNKRDK